MAPALTGRMLSGAIVAELPSGAVNEFDNGCAGALRPRVGLMARRWQVLALLLATALFVFRSPWSASNLEVPPDSAEYSLGALQLLETGRYQIVVQAEAFPPRYPPWFSLGLLPAYWLLGAEPGNGILPVLLSAMAGVGFAWVIGRRLAGDAGGIVAALAVMAEPTYSKWATQIMSDIPATALMLGAACLFLRIRAGGTSPQRRFFLAAGAVVAAATLIRPVFAAMLLPFLWAAVQPWKPRIVIARAVLLLGPMLCAAAASLTYNTNTFGSPFRNGYHFWVPVPYDYFAMVFSLAHVPANFAILLSGPLPFLLGACALLYVPAMRGTRAHPGSTGASATTLRDFFVFVLCTSVPILIFHLVYFFPSERFFIPLYVSCAVIAAVLLTRALGQYRRVAAVLPLVALVLAVGWRVAESDPVPNRRLAAERIRAHTPADAIVISAIDPLYLNYFAARGSARRIVPLDRTIDHTGVIAPKRVPRLEPPPTANDPFSGMLNGGGTFAVRVVAVEQLPVLVEAARHGRAVFLDTSCMRNADRPILELLDRYFRSVPREQGLYQLEPL
jgi:Dolichyl-phosphate-mannose-protein mannosyltransferase